MFLTGYFDFSVYCISQDDSYVDSYISTIGVDFVSITLFSFEFYFWLFTFIHSLLFMVKLNYLRDFPENQNCGA